MLRLKLVRKKSCYLYYTYFPLWSPIVKLLSPSLSTALRLESGALPKYECIRMRTSWVVHLQQFSNIMYILIKTRELLFKGGAFGSTLNFC
jgi:hypothetical protein